MAMNTPMIAISAYDFEEISESSKLDVIALVHINIYNISHVIRGECITKFHLFRLIVDACIEDGVDST